MLACDIALAARIERAEARLLSDGIARVARRVGERGDVLEGFEDVLGLALPAVDLPAAATATSRRAARSPAGFEREAPPSSNGGITFDYHDNRKL